MAKTELEISLENREKFAVKEVSKDLAKRVLEVVDLGLSDGMGDPIPGKMCVEAAVCYAMGQEHSDEPTCVHHTVRDGKITLNDNGWSTPKTRAKGMRRLAVAQLGSTRIDEDLFLDTFASNLMKLLLSDVIKECEEKELPFLAPLKKLKNKKANTWYAFLYGLEPTDNWYVNLFEQLDNHKNPMCQSLYTLIRKVEDGYPSAERLVNVMDAWYPRKTKKATDERLTMIADCMEDALRKAKSPGVKWLSLCEV